MADKEEELNVSTEMTEKQECFFENLTLYCHNLKHLLFKKKKIKK